MSKQIIVQKDLDRWRRIVITGEDDKRHELKPGLYCVWSTVVDDIVAFNMTEDALVEFFVEEARNNIVRKVKATCHELQTGESPYFQFTMSFAEAVHHAEQLHGEDHYEHIEVAPRPILGEEPPRGQGGEW